MRIYIILCLLIPCNAIGSQEGFGKAFDEVVRGDMMKHGIIKPFLNHCDVSVLKRTCTFFNNSYHYHMLDVSTIAEIPEEICTKALMFFAENNLDDNFNKFSYNNNRKKREAMVTLFGWKVDSERKSAYSQGIKTEKPFTWNSVFINSIALDVALLRFFSTPDTNNNTVLMFAAFNEYKDIVERLLKNNADPNTQTKDGNTALMSAVIGRDLAIVELLLAHKAKLDVRDQYGRTALKIAVEYDRRRIVKLLLKDGADPNIQDEEGETALMHAADYGYTYIMKLLLKNNANPDIQRKDGFTALMLAKTDEVMKLLLKHNANPALKSSGGYTALDFAKARQHPTSIKLLEEEPLK